LTLAVGDPRRDTASGEQAVNWRAHRVRGVAAGIFGVQAVIWPNLDLPILVGLAAIWALAVCLVGQEVALVGRWGGSA
jgi:hypothetical protein